jgi:hypothetical protein
MGCLSLAHEVPQVEAALLAEVDELDKLNDRLKTSQKSLDVDTLFHIQRATLPHKNLPHCHQILTAVSCAFTIPLILYFLFRSKLHYLTSCCPHTNNSPKLDATPQPSSSRASTRAPDNHRENGSTLRKRHFATYALPCTN